MPTLTGVHLLPATGEFVYDTVAMLGQRLTEPALTAINTFAGGGATTDYSTSLDQLQAQHPECATVSLVCAWFTDGLTAGSCNVFPTTTYIGGSFQKAAGGADHWRCSGLTEASAGLIAIPADASGHFIYGGTPSDSSIVRCIQDLKARGLRVVFYPFLLSIASGEPWRGRIGYSPDVSGAATTAVNAFLGSATTGQFTRDAVNLTVGYSGSSTDWTYRRMILHYANLCVVAGGVDLFVIGSEMRGLETVRGPAWTHAGTVDGGGKAIWDYPFVAGLKTLAADVRSIFTAAGLTKNIATLKNLIAYSADWSSWMGFQHPGENGQWPHLDQLWADANIDAVSFDNYLPLSDWTTNGGGLDAANWQAPAPSSWPVALPATRGFGLSGAPSIYSTAYLQANIEGGEKFDWYYSDGSSARGFDPNGSGQIVSAPAGDRAAQTRQPYYSGQEILGPKQVRWWWNTAHHAIYDTGSGWVQQGPATEWVAQSKPVIFLEYGFPACDRATNQPNVFFAAGSIESATPYWSAWDSASGGGLLPRRDDTLFELSLNAVYDYWQAHNATAGGVKLIEWTFCCVWNWDARPFPTFPERADVWGDAGNWAAGNWLGAGRTSLPPVAPSADPTPGSFPTFPALATLGWSVHLRPKFATSIAGHVSGKEARARSRTSAAYEVELTYELLRADANAELQTLAGFYLTAGGANALFWFTPTNAPADFGAPRLCRFSEDVADLENFMALLWRWGSVKLQTVRF